MKSRSVLPLKSCFDPALVGGKAAGLGKMIRNGFPVPSGLCMTTIAYNDTLRAGGIEPLQLWARVIEAPDTAQEKILEECRRYVGSLTLTQNVLNVLDIELDQLEREMQIGKDALWAVRSSATDEDTVGASFAGVYYTRLGVSRRDLVSTIIECWASWWTPAALAYRRRTKLNKIGALTDALFSDDTRPPLHPPAPGAPRRVFFPWPKPAETSPLPKDDALFPDFTHPPQAPSHPAHPGPAETGPLPKAALLPAMAVILQPLLSPIASGVAYSRHPVTGRTDVVVINSIFGLAEPLVGGRVTPDHFVVKMGNQSEPGSILERNVVVKTIQRMADQNGLKDQPLSVIDHHRPSLDDRHVIVLAVLAKEVEQTFGLAVDVEWALDHRGIWLLQARPISIPTSSHEHAWASCTWSRANLKETLPEVPSPLGLSYLEQFMEANFLRHYRESGCLIPPGLSSVRIIKGRPYINVSLFQSLAAQLGGKPELVTEQMGGEPARLPHDLARLAWWRLLKAGMALLWKIFRASQKAPAWFEELKRMGLAQDSSMLKKLTLSVLLKRLDSLGKRLEEGELTFAIVGGVSQSFHVLRTTLARRTPKWRTLLNTAIQGFGQIISADQIYRLMALANIAEHDARVRAVLLTESSDPEAWRTSFIGTKFVDELEAYFSEYGHRAIGESDVMTPRFAETPAYILNIIREHLLAGTGRSVETIRREQEKARQTALDHIRSAFGWRRHEWIWFCWWRRLLGRYLVLREANRHALMYYSTGARRILLAVGEQLVADGVVETREDVFYFTDTELRSVVSDPKPEWKHIIALRRAEQETHAAQSVPDTIVEESDGNYRPIHTRTDHADIQNGLSISAGYAEGPVCLIRSPDDFRKVKQGDILIVPVIDPGMAPLFALASGLIAEMGGTLSHGAIIAREYGISAVANVPDVMRKFKNGERIAVDAERGEVRRVEP